MLEQKLIDQLRKHTNQKDADNQKNYWANQNIEEHNRIYQSMPYQMPAILYFADSSSVLFMSLHNELANGYIHYHDFFELIYVIKGNPIGMINDQEVALQEGNLCIMNPNAVHYFKEYSDETDLILNILLPKDLFQKSIFRILFNDPLLNSFFIRYRLENEHQPSFLHLQYLDKDIDGLIELLVKEYLDKRQYSQVIIESLLTLIFSLILRNYKEKTSNDNHATADIIDYIYQNYQSVNMVTLAAHFNYHPKYLSSLIHKQTGQTFRNLIVNIKLQNALNYLIYTEFSIEQIVDLIGYKDKSSFYALLKKEFNLSPMEYRKHYS
ncbi:MAG: AraC family transcriptional regulator [Mobilitalea sp.]